MAPLVPTQCKYGIGIEVRCSQTSGLLPRCLTRFPAAPQPAQKHFTDEELKQQYGIHLATRLQADGDGKESKWADIDDDEDDWAPETIEWNDGTKITLSQNDSAAILAEEQAAALRAKERQAEENKAKVSAQQKPATTVGPNATVLKPRSAAQPKPGGLVLKTPSDKPTLVAKPAAPTPVRSPWASLPPVEKVPPVDINPSSRPSTSRTPQNEPYGNNNMQPPPATQTAMEIAADDFTRTRRDNQNGNLGQLYNAQSGQYEPANTGRRGSVRKDQNFRPPSLLQRGSPHDQHGPAEPSAAFQTHRSGSQQDPAPWARRGSSTVSGDSGPQDRRMSMNKGTDLPRIPHDLLQQRRESQPLQSPSTPGFGQNQILQHGSSPAQQPASSAVQSPAIQHSQLSHEPGPTTGSPYQHRNLVSETNVPNTRDDVAAQKQLMKEKRELAIKRKKEEEEREEAAKKERIRLKMEKLGLPPLEEKKESEKKTIERRGPESVKIEQKEAEKLEVTPDVHQNAPQLQEKPPSMPLSPPKPPAPDASGTPQQYGMMRVHSTPSNNAPQVGSERLIVEKTRTQAPIQLVSPPGLEAKTELNEQLPPPMVNGVQKQTETIAQKSPPDAQHPVREQRQQPWNNGPRDNNGYSGWNGTGAGITREQSVSNSVWGPPTQHRTLGNGTFDRSVQRPQSRQQEQFSSPALAPIGPPRQLQRLREVPQTRANDISTAPVVEDFQTIPTFPPSEAPIPSMRPEITSRPTSGDQQNSSSQVGAGAQSRSQINNIEGPSTRSDLQKSTLASWGNFHIADAERNRQLSQQHAARLADEARTGIRQEPPLPIMNETWRQVRVDEHGGQRHIVGVSRGQNAHGQNVVQEINGDIHSSSFNNTGVLAPAMATGVGRGSRFFPSAGRGIQPYFQGVPPFLPGYVRSPSPPPPDNDIHPVFTGDRGRPLVNLPFVKEKPKVRLPPSVATPTQSPKSAEVRVIPLRGASQPLVNNPSWQDRFNGLLGVKKSSPEKKFALVAEFSATKVPLDSPEVQVSASVSLPPKNGEGTRSLEVDSKAMEDEEALFENREFGSLPAVQIPSNAPEIGWSSAKSMRRGQYKQSRLSKEVESTSREPLKIEKEITTNNGIALIFINLFGMAASRSVPVPRSSGQNLGQGVQRPRNASGTLKQVKPYKSRDNSGSFGNNPAHNPSHNPKHSHGGPPRNIVHLGPNPQTRQPHKNHTAWGPRLTADAVH